MNEQKYSNEFCHRQPCSLHHVFGFSSSNRSNPLALRANEMLYISGNSIIHYNMENKQRKYTIGIDKGGIGCISFKKERNILFVGEKGYDPNIYAYNVNDFKVFKKLKGGAERGYAFIDVNSAGDKVCSVSGKPDFSLTIWDWENESIILKKRAYGQEVFRCHFSPFDDGFLVTSGVGHIRFWKMATTFTGLKLQGHIGKFGKVDLSDIETFAILPDGRVVSGSESGHLLLWESNCIKCRFTTKTGECNISNECLINGKTQKKETSSDPNEGYPAHKNGIYYVKYDASARQLVTAGGDGSIKFWAIKDMYLAEVDCNSTTDCEIQPYKAICIDCNGASIRNIVEPFDDKGIIFAHDSTGIGWRVELETMVISQETKSQAEPIVGIDVSPSEHLVVTAGINGTVRCYDFVSKQALGLVRCPQRCSTVKWAPKNMDRSCRSIIIGFQDGVVKWFRFTGEFSLVCAVKPHTEAITSIDFSVDACYMSTGADDGSIFIFETPQNDGDFQLKPIGFLECEKSLNSLSWKADGLALVYTTKCGDLIEVDVSGKLHPSSKDTYLIDHIKTKHFQFPGHLVTHAHDENTTEGGGQWASIDNVHFLAVKYRNDINDGFFVTLKNKEGNASIYGCSFDENFKFEQYSAEQLNGMGNHSVLQEILYSSSGHFLLSCAKNGSVTIRSPKNLRFYALYDSMHDSDFNASGAVLSFDDNFLLTAGMDGVLVVQRITPRKIYDLSASTEPEQLSNVSTNSDEFIYGVENYADGGKEGETTPPFGFDEVMSNVLPCITGTSPTGKDIVNESICSLEEEKASKCNRSREAAAEEGKTEVKSTIATMRKEFKIIAKQNASIPTEIQLSSEQMNVDCAYKMLLMEENDECLENVRQEFAYISETISRRADKLKETFVNSLDCEHVTVSGITASHQKVQTFVTGKLRVAYTHNSTENYVLSNSCTLEIETSQNKISINNSQISCENRSRTNAQTNNNTSFLHVRDLGKKTSTFDTRKAMRAARKKALQDKLSEMPSEEAEQEKGFLIEKDSGDYKIKSSQDYVVPDKDDSNPCEKRSEIKRLEHMMYDRKMEFNKRVLLLQNKRKTIMEIIRKNNDRLGEIRFFLDEKDTFQSLWDELKVDEELKTNLADPSISSKEDKPKVPSDSCVFPFVPPSSNIPLIKNDSNQTLKEECNILTSQSEVFRPPQMHMNNIRPMHINGESSYTPLEHTQIKYVQNILVHERQSITSHVKNQVDMFDEDLSLMRREHHKILLEIKSAEIRLSILHEELEVLQKFHGAGQSLQQKEDHCTKEMKEIQNEKAASEGRYENKKEEIDETLVGGMHIMEEFSKAVPENHLCYDHLRSILCQKAKKSYEDDSDEDEENSSDDYNSSDDDTDPGKEGPPSCNKETLEFVCQLRDKKRFLEEETKRLKKQLDEFKRNSERLLTKEIQMEREIVKIASDKRKFKQEKLQALNELFIPVPLSAAQLFLQDYDGMSIVKTKNPPKTMGLDHITKENDSIIFSNDHLMNLKRRVHNLNDDIVRDKLSFKELQKQKSTMLRESVLKEDDIKAQQHKCNDLQMLKFGQLLDMDAVDNATENEEDVGTVEIDRANTLEQDQAVSKLSKHHLSLKMKLMGITVENTSILNQIAKLNERQIFLEKEINESEKKAVDEVFNKDCVKEKKKLHLMVRMQNGQINALKKEINSFKRKTGHINAPTQH